METRPRSSATLARPAPRAPGGPPGAYLRKRNAADVPARLVEAKQSERRQQQEVQSGPDPQEGAVQGEAAPECGPHIEDGGGDEKCQADAEEAQDRLEGVHDVRGQP